MKRINNIVKKNSFTLGKEVREFENIFKKNINSKYAIGVSSGTDAKIHYPIPMHMQKPSSKFGYRRGMFKMSENISKKIISLPVHEFIKKSDLDYMINSIYKFYSSI